MNTITKQDIELSELLRKACADNGITEPRFVAMDNDGRWFHFLSEPWHQKNDEIWDSLDDIDDIKMVCIDEPNPNWLYTLMEFITPTIEAGKRYWRRDGSVSEEIEPVDDCTGLVCWDGLYSYTKEGYYIPHRRCELDLIAEYVGSEPLTSVLNRTCAECGKPLEK